MFETLYVVFQFFDNLKQQSPHIENIYYLHFAGLLLLFLFFNHTRESMYDPSRLKVTLWHLKRINCTKSKTKSLCLINVSKLSLYLKRSDFKEFVNNIIKIIIRGKFYNVTRYVHFTLFSAIFWRDEIDCSCELDFPDIWMLKIFYYIL